MLRVLVVDDSAFMRRELTRIVDSDPDCRVVGTASDGREGLEKAKALQPDVVTLDVNLPIMDGLTCLQYIMIESPRPCVMISALTGENSLETFEALELGAVDFIRKPSGEISRDIRKSADAVIRKVKAAARANMSAVAQRPQAPESKVGTKSAPGGGTPDAAVVIAVSTGGPRALMKIVPKLPANLGAPVLIVQHMPPKFTASFAERLDSHCSMPVKEARDNERLLTDTVYVAPGGFHLGVKKEGADFILHTVEPEENETLAPSANRTMNDCVDLFGSRTVGVVLTGMGNDGLKAMTRLFRLGGSTIAESKTSAVIYGMPKEVIERGVARQIVPAESVAGAVVRAVNRLGKAKA